MLREIHKTLVFTKNFYGKNTFSIEKYIFVEFSSQTSIVLWKRLLLVTKIWYRN